MKHGCSIFELRESPTADEWRTSSLSVWSAIFSTNALPGAEVERLHLPLNPWIRDGVSHLGDLVLHYAEHELVERSEFIHPKAHTTIRGYDRVLRTRLLPKRGNRIALGIEPLEVEECLTTLKKEEELEYTPMSN